MNAVWTQVISECTSELIIMCSYICEQECEQECEQMLKMKPQHRKQGNREHVLCVQCAVRTVYSTCKWDRIVRTVVQYVLWCHTFIWAGVHGVKIKIPEKKYIESPRLKLVAETAKQLQQNSNSSYYHHDNHYINILKLNAAHIYDNLQIFIIIIITTIVSIIIITIIIYHLS